MWSSIGTVREVSIIFENFPERFKGRNIKFLGWISLRKNINVGSFVSHALQRFGARIFQFVFKSKIRTRVLTFVQHFADFLVGKIIVDFDVEAEIAEALSQFYRVRGRAFSPVEAGHLELLVIEDHAFTAILVIHIIPVRVFGHRHVRGNGRRFAEVTKYQKLSIEHSLANRAFSFQSCQEY